MSHIILTGATGLVGSGVLQQMLAMEGISQISILSRRPVKMAEGHEDKAKVILHTDYKNYDEALLEQLKDANGVVWAQGVSQNAVDKTQYREITYDYPLAAAEAFSKLHPDSPFTFVYVSGAGATQNPGMMTPLFGRVKGEAEQALFDLAKKTPNFHIYNVRPQGVDPKAHTEIHSFMPKQEWYKTTTLSLLGSTWKSTLTPTRELGKILTELAMSKGAPLEGKDIGMEGTLVPNSAIRRITGLDPS